MNATDVLAYGQLTILGTLDGLAADQWEEPGVCGRWSVKDIVAHLASYELVLVDILMTFTGGGQTPCLDLFREQGADFNDGQVAARAGQDGSATLDELNAAHKRVMELLGLIPGETQRRPGSLPWYGAAYALDDLLVYMFYGHKREHSAQIAVWRNGSEEKGAP